MPTATLTTEAVNLTTPANAISAENTGGTDASDDTVRATKSLFRLLLIYPQSIAPDALPYFTDELVHRLNRFNNLDDLSTATYSLHNIPWEKLHWSNPTKPPYGVGKHLLAGSKTLQIRTVAALSEIELTDPLSPDPPRRARVCFMTLTPADTDSAAELMCEYSEPKRGMLHYAYSPPLCSHSHSGGIGQDGLFWAGRWMGTYTTPVCASSRPIATATGLTSSLYSPSGSLRSTTAVRTTSTSTTPTPKQNAIFLQFETSSFFTSRLLAGRPTA